MSTTDIQLDERKQKLRKEIDEHNLKLEELKHETSREVERLRKERESLGFLAIRKMKEIDQRSFPRKNRFPALPPRLRFSESN